MSDTATPPAQVPAILDRVISGRLWLASDPRPRIDEVGPILTDAKLLAENFEKVRATIEARTSPSK